MEKVVIKKEDVVCFDRYNRDRKLVNLALNGLIFLNTITFGLIEDRLLFQYEKLLKTWVKSMDKPGYFDKK